LYGKLAITHCKIGRAIIDLQEQWAVNGRREGCRRPFGKNLKLGTTARVWCFIPLTDEQPAHWSTTVPVERNTGCSALEIKQAISTLKLAYPAAA
jgi:hypothetical protein